MVIHHGGMRRPSRHRLGHIVEEGFQRAQRQRGVREDVGPAGRPLLRQHIDQEQRRFGNRA